MRGFFNNSISILGSVVCTFHNFATFCILLVTSWLLCVHVLRYPQFDPLTFLGLSNTFFDATRDIHPIHQKLHTTLRTLGRIQQTSRQCEKTHINIYTEKNKVKSLKHGERRRFVVVNKPCQLM